jgi:hypothetical protein
MDIRLAALSERFIVFSVCLLMASVYLAPNYTDNLFYYFFFIAFAFSLRFVSVRETLLNPMVRAIIALIAYTALSTLWAHDSGRYGFEVLKDGAYLLVALVVVNAAVRQFGTSRIVDILMATSLACASLVVATSYLLAPAAVTEAFFSGTRLTHWSFVGMAENPIHSGFFVGLATLFAVHSFRSAKTGWVSLLFLVQALGLGVFVVLTKSRGAIFFLAISAALLICLIRPKNRWRDLVLLLIAAGTLSTILALNPEMLLSRIGGKSIRMDILNEYGKLYLASPVFGVGWSENLGIVTGEGLAFSKPHNSFFHVLLVCGLGGFILFAIMTIYPLWFAAFSRHESTVILGLWFLFGCLYIAVDGRYPVRHPSAQWLYYWIPLYLLIGRMLEVKSETKRASLS